MGSKSKLKFGKKKKKSKSNEGRHIGAALIPAAAFCGVPRLHSIPTPTLLRQSSWGLSSALMNASALTRLMGTPSPSLARPLSDSDNSICEPVSPRDATTRGSHSRGRHGNRRRRRRSTYGSNDYSYGRGSHEYSSGAYPGPPHGFGDDDIDYDTETEITRTPSPQPKRALRKSMEVEAEINPVYTTSLKSSQRSRSASPSSLRMSTTLTETGSLPYHSTLRSSQGASPQASASGGLLRSGSGGARRGVPKPTRSNLSPQTSIEERIEAQMVQSSQRSSLRSSMDKSLTRVSTDLSHTGSFRLNSLREQNAALVDKQAQLERQLSSQRIAQEQLMTKLREQGLLSTNQSAEIAGSTQENLASLLEETQKKNVSFSGKPIDALRIKDSCHIIKNAKTNSFTESDSSLLCREDSHTNQSSTEIKPTVVQKVSKATSVQSSIYFDQFQQRKPDVVEELSEYSDFESNDESTETPEEVVPSLPQHIVDILERMKILEEKREEARNIEEIIPVEITASDGMTDQTLDRQSAVVDTLKERLLGYEQEKKELEDINEQLRAEVVSVHRLASARDEDEARTQSTVVKKLRDERDALQAMTIKLNAELGRYQAKYRTLSQGELEQLPGLPFTSSKPSWLINTKYLAPLLVAYDDQLRERDSALQQSASELEEVYGEVETVIRENQRLHARMGDGDANNVGMTEWRSLQEQCKLVLEENQLLMEQLDVQQNKVKDVHKAHVQEVSKLSKRLVIAEAERGQLEQEVADIRDKMAAVKKDHTRAVVESRSKLETDEHLEGIGKIKGILEDEKKKHAQELENTMVKLQSMASDRKSLSIQVEDLQAEKQTIEVEMKTVQKALKKSQKKVQILQQALQDSEVKEQTAEKYLSSVIKVAEKTAKERDTFVERAEAELKQKKAAMTKILEEKMTKSKMEEKLKLMRLKASEKLEKAANRMKEQDTDFGQQRSEYEREIKHLRLLLRERQEMIDEAVGDKNRVEADLETMWQVAVSDNQRMKETVRKSLRRLEGEQPEGVSVVQ